MILYGARGQAKVIYDLILSNNLMLEYLVDDSPPETFPHHLEVFPPKDELLKGKKMIIAIIYIMILQQIDGNIIYPRVVGGAMKIHPLTIMVLLVLGGNIYGLIGMLVAVPGYAIIKEIVKFAAGVYDYHKKNKIVL